MGKDEEMAESAVKDINNRWFDKKPIYAELSPVSDFREACCRQYELGECNRGGFCNFMHLKPISRQLRKALYKRNKYKKREDRKTREHTAGGRHGGYAGGYGGRSSTQYAAEKKFNKMESLAENGGGDDGNDGRPQGGGSLKAHMQQQQQRGYYPNSNY